MAYNYGFNKNPYGHWWKEKIAKIEHIEIQAGSNSKSGSDKFISFSLLIGNFSRFKWLITVVLMKVPIVIDEKKRSRKLSIWKF